MTSPQPPIGQDPLPAPLVLLVNCGLLASGYEVVTRLLLLQGSVLSLDIKNPSSVPMGPAPMAMGSCMTNKVFSNTR